MAKDEETTANNDPVKKGALRELFLFSDEPLRGHLEKDHLALQPFAEMIASAAITNRGPFNIGVFSGWGQGKTSVLKQAQSLIEAEEKPNVITVWVNAWQYEKEEHPIVPLIALIIREINKVLAERQSLWETGTGKVKEAFLSLTRSLRAIAYGFSAKAGVKIPGFANLEIGFVAKDMIEREAKLSSDRDPLLDQSLYYHAYEQLEAFGGIVKGIAKKEQPRIIVFVDDLDRCLPDNALKLLETLKLLFAQPGFIFILAVDRQIIDAFLTKRYESEFGLPEDKHHGKQYMDKIIQLPLRLPHHQSRFETYIKNLINDPNKDRTVPDAFKNIFSDENSGDEFCAALAAGCEHSPRSFLRTLNYLLTDLFLREGGFYKPKDDPFNNNEDFLQFAAVSRIVYNFFGSDKEEDYRKLVGANTVCGELAKHLGKTKARLPDPSPDPHPSFVILVTKSDTLKKLFGTDIGQKWLNEDDKRRAIDDLLTIGDSQTGEDSQKGSDPDAPSSGGPSSGGPSSGGPSSAGPSSGGVAPNLDSRIIDTAICKTLGLSGNTPITKEHRERVTKLDLSNTKIADITPLQNLSKLNTLSLHNTQVADIKPLKNLTNLNTLDLHNTQVADIKPLKNLTNLNTLDLSVTKVADISPLQNLTNLNTLYLSVTKVADISPLQNLSNLNYLFINGTPAAGNESAKDRLKVALPNINIIDQFPNIRDL